MIDNTFISPLTAEQLELYKILAPALEKFNADDIFENISLQLVAEDVRAKIKEQKSKERKSKEKEMSE